MSDLGALWRELAQEPVAIPGRLQARRVRPEARFEIFAALEQPRNRPLLLVHLDAGVFSKDTRFPESTGFEVRRELAREERGQPVRLMLQLSREQYLDIFTVLAQDVLESMVQARTDRECVELFSARLALWQEFLGRHGPDGLGEVAQRGLYGELWFLRNFAVPLRGTTAGVHAWTGPAATDQDFQWASCAVEVKTTAANPHHRVHVSNVRQLDGRGVPALVLLHLVLEQRQGAGESLVEMVGAVRQVLGDIPVARIQFDERLRAAGYLDVHAARYEAARYIVRGHAFYQVGEGFPRILEEDLRPGVGDVSYSVAISACTPFRIGDDALRTLLEA